MKRGLIAIFLLIVMCLTVSAKEADMTLLTFAQRGNETFGGTANLNLEIEPGKGRLFIDTYPLTKMDTQISTRFAKEIACNYLEKDCSGYNFYYTIRSDAPIIGGPSASAAITIITISLLSGEDFSDDVAITGTINSGGFIGPVSGIEEKIDAASKNGFAKVLIPKGASLYDDNSTINISKLEDNYSIEIIEISNLDEAVIHFFGKELKQVYDDDIEKDKAYAEVMKKLSDKLCVRTAELKDEFSAVDFIENESSEYGGIKEQARNLTISAAKAMSSSNFYSAASYCFGANLKYAYLIDIEKNLTDSEIITMINEVEKNITSFEDHLSNISYVSLTDLEAQMITNDRAREARDYLKSALEENNTDDKIYYVNYANERLYSAVCWSEFFNVSKEKADVSKEAIKNACIQKISEAEERVEYVSLYIPIDLSVSRGRINSAEESLKEGDYESCLFKASKAKASVNTIISLIGFSTEEVDDILDSKLVILKRFLNKQIEKGQFPVIGYSYYEYAMSLREKDPQSSLLYIEYALELSNLDIYFNKKSYHIFIRWDYIGIYIVGLVIGFILFPVLAHTNKRRKKKNRS